MIKLIATATAAAVATLLAGCVVAPDAGYGYGYGQTYYSDPGYAYGPAYAPVYGTVNVWGGGRDWDRHDYRRDDRDWRRDRGWDDRNWGDRGNGRWNRGNRPTEGNRASGGARDWRGGQGDNDRGNGRWH
ncbi:hypothetical protein [Burkholderia ubonensis]|uniref:hypothetical protein n=1 Tax=Burkholderia ubonensis TaxID=101571 RepID=UPI000754E0E9|nr:hypothetical protein [Burkholderia ubonensis]KWE83495.1 hypothetical protein WL81_29545 [Burkholderia ubonensis]